MAGPKDAIRKAVKQGLALVVYQDDTGVHVGVIDNEAIREVRERKDVRDEPLFPQGWLDTEGGDIGRLDDFSAFEQPWSHICEILTEED